MAREYNLSIDLKLVRARTVDGALLDLIADGEYDMIIIGTRKKELQGQVEKLLKEAPCRVLYCKS